MNIRDRIRRWLGIEDILNETMQLDLRIVGLHDKFNRTSQETRERFQTLNVAVQEWSPGTLKSDLPTDVATELDHLRFRERELADIIREMDQKIWNIGQGLQSSPPPGFRELYTETARRMVDESNRMKDVLIPEMMKAYKRPAYGSISDEITKQQASLPSPIDGKR